MKPKANETRYLDIFTASRETQTVKLHIHYITSPLKFPF